MSPLTLSLHIAALQTSPGWWRQAVLRELVAGDDPLAVVLAYACGPDPLAPGFAFLAAQAGRTLRSVAVVDVDGDLAVVAFDQAAGAETVNWRLIGEAPARRFQTPSGDAGEQMLLHLITLSGAGRPAANLSGPDVAGVRFGDWAVFFYAERRPARSTLSFGVGHGGGITHILMTGLAPGAWEVWHNGWLEDHQAIVAPPAACLYYEGGPGEYFLRRLG